MDFLVEISIVPDFSGLNTHFFAGFHQHLPSSSHLWRQVGGSVKECLEQNAKLSARIDDLCDALVKEVPWVVESDGNLMGKR